MHACAVVHTDQIVVRPAIWESLLVTLAPLACKDKQQYCSGSSSGDTLDVLIVHVVRNCNRSRTTYMPFDCDMMLDAQIRGLEHSKMACNARFASK